MQTLEPDATLAPARPAKPENNRDFPMSGRTTDKPKELESGFRGYRFLVAQPPANVQSASGVHGVHWREPF
jgi:hypothetical protein